MATPSAGRTVALLATSTLVLLPLSAYASPQVKSRTVEVRAEYTEPMPRPDGVHCRGLGSSTPWCQVVVPGPATFTGTIAGEAYAESAGPTRSGNAYEGPDTFERAAVQGCGVGSLVIDTFEGDFDVTDTRAGDASTGATNKWRIRPGSGTGTLVGISGNGVNHWRVFWTESGDRWGRGVFTGTITCEVPRAR